MGWDPQNLLKVVVHSILGTSGILAKIKVNTYCLLLILFIVTYILLIKQTNQNIKCK